MVSASDDSGFDVAGSGSFDLPPLRVEIRRDGVAVDVVEIRDPRIGFCRFWAELHGDDGLTAVPI